MSDNNDLNNLIQIIERLEISARERDGELHHAREVIRRLQKHSAGDGGKNSVALEIPLSSPSAVESWKIITPLAIDHK